MGERSTIEWTDATWNPVRGCSRVSQGCVNCYAEIIAARFSGPGMAYDGVATRKGGDARWTGALRIAPAQLDAPLRWRTPRRIFANSMSDLFHEKLPVEEIATIYAIAVAAVHLRGHTIQILTKRAARQCEILQSGAFWDQVNAEVVGHVLESTDPLDDARATLDDYGPDNPPPGIWHGVSIEDQPTADERIHHLRATPAAVRFISAEPLLGAIDLTCIDDAIVQLDWVIVGGESGPGARPMSIQWARELRDQCAAAGVPFFFKQWGEWAPAGAHRAGDPGRFAFGDYEHDRTTFSQVDGYPRQFTKFGARSTMQRVGKKAAGRLLDGRAHDAFPNDDRSAIAPEVQS